MDNRFIELFEDSKKYTNLLRSEFYDSMDTIKECVGGEILDEYLKAGELAENTLGKIEKELQELQQIIALLEVRSTLM